MPISQCCYWCKHCIEDEDFDGDLSLFCVCQKERNLVAAYYECENFMQYEIKAQWVLPSKGQIFYPCNYICSQCGYDSGVRCFWQTKEIKRCSGCNALMG